MREVVGAAPEAFVPAHADRAGDALERLLHVVGVGEVVAAQPQLPTVHRTGTAAPVVRSVDEHDERACRRAE